MNKSVTGLETSTKRKKTVKVDTQNNKWSKPMSEEELAERLILETAIDAQFLEFFAIGDKLKIINDRGFFRPYSDLGHYCLPRFGFGPAYAYRHINAAVVYNHLKQFSPNGEMPLPQNEAQVRPLTNAKLKTPEQWLKAWERSVKKAKGGRITEDLVAEEVAKMLGVEKPNKHKEKPKGTALPANARVSVPSSHLGEMLRLCTEIRRNVEEGHYHDAMKCIVEIELLIKSEQPAAPVVGDPKESAPAAAIA